MTNAKPATHWRELYCLDCGNKERFSVDSFVQDSEGVSPNITLDPASLRCAQCGGANVVSTRRRTDAGVLRDIKEQYGLRWSEMAAQLGVTKNTLERIACAFRPLSTEMARRIRDVYGIDVGLDDEGSPVGRQILGYSVLLICRPQLTKQEAWLQATLYNREGWPWRQPCSR